MPSIDSLIQQVRESGLSQKQKDELVKRIVREGPDFDLLSAIAATEPPSEKKAKILISESKAMSIFAAVLMIPLFLVFYPVASRWIDSFRGEPVAVAPVPKATSAPAPRVDTSPPREDTEGGAYVWAKGFVEERLRSPSTAKFPWIWNAHFTDMGNRTWKVVSYVDAQNAFGAEIRKYFEAEVQYVGNGQWKLISIKFE